MAESISSRQHIISFFRKRDLYYAVARYALSPLMMSFGLMKIMGMQFHNIAGPTSSYQQPLEYLTGIQLTWAFLGYSGWFQVVLGIMEFVPSFLLLFRRTAFFGALALLPMTLSVCLINFSMHLWDNTRTLSLFLLVLNLLIIAIDWRKVKQIATIALGTETKYKYLLPELLVAIILMAIPVVRKVQADYGRSTQNVLTGDWFRGRPNEFTLLAEKVNDSTLPHQPLKCFFGAWEEYSEINDSEKNWDGYKPYSVDESDHTVVIAAYPNRMSRQRGQSFYRLSGKFHYELSGDSALVLLQVSDDSTAHTWVFRKRVMRVNRTY
jgi:uncharacterized membrane protein YphA (DoxX/SURF4 family)